MKESTNWGVLGAAKIARTSVAPAIHAADNAVVGGIASRSEDKAAAFAGHYPRARAYSSYEALLADEAIDTIYIPLPNDLHVEWSLRALASGKHVLCEKPMALQAADFDAIRAERDRTGLVAAEAFMVVHHPQWLRVKELLEQEAIGELRHIAGSFAYNNSNAPDNIRQKPEHGGGALNDIGVYPVVVTRFVTGVEPTTFKARSQWEQGVDTTTHASLGFDGFTTDFYCSMRMAPRQSMVFHGSDGWISVEAPFTAHAYADVVIDIRSRGQQTIERFVPVNQYRRMIEAFGAAVGGEGEVGCSLGFSQANQRVIDSLRAASLAAGDAGSTS